jgi:HK97 family phage portal protein
VDEYTTDTGARVVSRAVVPRDTPNTIPDDLASTVGPSTTGGAVMFDANLPISPQPWNGWPVDWQVPNWGGPSWLTSRTSTVGTCVDTIGRTCSTFPPRVMRKTELLDPQPLWTTNPEPVLYVNFDEWVKGVINSLLLRGNAYVLSTGRNAEGFPVRWVTLNPDHVTVEFEDRIVYELNREPLPAGDVLHLKYQQIPGWLLGVGPLDWTARDIVGASALAQYGSDLASRGGVPWGVLTHPGNLRDGQAETIRDQWLTAQANRGGAPAILSGGMTLETLSLSPENMALLSLREFDEQRIAAAFGVPPSYLNMPQPSGLTYNTAQMIQSHFYWDTLRPMVKNIGDGLSNWALPRGTNAVFDASDYLAPALPELVAALVAAAPLVPEAADQLRDALGIPSTSGMSAPDPMGVTA